MEEHPYRYYYKPQNAAAADFIPFWYDGKFRLFYLHDWRDIDNYGTGVPWYLIETEDLLHFDEKGEVIPRGTPEEPDNYIFTGSIIRANDQFHIFYTAHNHRMIDKGLPQELITHAASDDLIHWKKLPEESFRTTPDCDPHNFRDPFVFFDEALGMYRMACVKRREGTSYISGITGQYVSKDLKNWEPAEDLWTPELFNTHECPDIFKIGTLQYEIKKYDCDDIYRDENGCLVPLRNASVQNGVCIGTSIKRGGADGETVSFKGEPALLKGDGVISVHIPAKADITEETCRKNNKTALEFFARYYPEYSIKAFMCHSWLMDPQLSELLRPDSNILGFQKFFAPTLHTSSSGDEAIYFVFGKCPKNLDELPETTTLTRSLKKRYLENNPVYAHLGIHFLEK